ncbi:MAG TPA: hypothetical protein VFO45_10745 [Sphingomicrobium sp.]|nr:hypothetical protein [Sphingomicrobium sp.]
MATVVRSPLGEYRRDHLTGTPRAHGLDRWIFVLTAALFIVVTLTGFIPDSLMKIELVRTGQRPPFPLVLHAHAVLMGAYLLLLLGQTWLVANGRCALHRRIGPVAMIIAPALVLVGFLLVPTTYHGLWEASQLAPVPARAGAAQRLWEFDNIMLLQLRIGFLFPILLVLGLRARDRNSGFHKRMMIMAPATALPAAFDRITWIPHTVPDSPLSPDLYVLFALAPMFLWDVIRNRRVHEAYWAFLAVALPFTLFVHAAWDTPWWHETARRLMGV